jgi:hypothetical protein
MKRGIFPFLIAAIVFVGVSQLQRQRATLAEMRLTSSARGAAAQPRSQDKSAPTPDLEQPERPSADLLQLRSEVTQLRRDLEAPVPRPTPPKEWAEEWSLVHSGPKPSQYPGFGYFTNLANVGFATPENAFQSFNFAMRNQQNERLTDARMKELWDVPDDFDDPDAKYSIHMGEGMGGEIGYRIVQQERIATNQIRLTIDYEKPDGSSFRREKVLVQKEGRWRVKPAGVTRAGR